MSEFFAFDELTWPEVEALTRQTPLALPSGHINEMDIEEQISNLLVDNQRVGLLPALPFGWEGSGLPVEPGLLETCRRNLHACLQEDGFERTLTLAPVPQDNLQFPADSEQGKVVLIPIGHTEQHAYHLPLSTDTLIIEAIAQGVAAAAPNSHRAAGHAVRRQHAPQGFPGHLQYRRAGFRGLLVGGDRHAGRARL
jgi:hypothetical protein